MASTSPTNASTDQAYHYPHAVAVCTLASTSLNQTLAAHPSLEGVIVSGLQTENIGLEQIIEFCVQQPALKAIILCGTDPTDGCGYLPGATFLALQVHGVNEQRRIIQAPGKRPVLANLCLEAIEHFRKTVTLVDFIGQDNPEVIVAEAQRWLQAEPKETTPYTGPVKPEIPTIQATTNPLMKLDPAGYLLVAVETPPSGPSQLSLTHVNKQGTVLHRAVGPDHQSLYQAAINQGWITTLDHAAYLGRELYRAEYALKTGSVYVQDDWIV